MISVSDKSRAVETNADAPSLELNGGFAQPGADFAASDEQHASETWCSSTSPTPLFC
jgi:hypothetical protein